MSLAVLLGRTFRESSLSFTLGVLAVVDTAVLCTVLPRQWILSLTHSQTDYIRTFTGAVGCKTHFFLTYYLSHLFTCISYLLTYLSPDASVYLLFLSFFSLFFVWFC